MPWSHNPTHDLTQDLIRDITGSHLTHHASLLVSFYHPYSIILILSTLFYHSHSINLTLSAITLSTIPYHPHVVKQSRYKACRSNLRGLQIKSWPRILVVTRRIFLVYLEYAQLDAQLVWTQMGLALLGYNVNFNPNRHRLDWWAIKPLWHLDLRSSVRLG